MNKTVSVYIPTHNRRDMLQRAVESVKQQTYPHWELLVVNDCSNDDTYEYLESIKSEKIKVFHQEIGRGACVARNLAINNATGIFITGLDDDDFFEKDRLALFVDAWNNRKDGVVFLFTGQKEIKGDELYIGRRLPFPTVEQKDILLGNYIGNQVFTPTDNLRQIKGFDEKLSMWQDFECWYRLLELGDGGYLDNTTYVFDVNDRDDRITVQKRDRVLETLRYFIKKHKLNFFERRIVRLHLVYYGFFSDNWLFKLRTVVCSLFLGNAPKLYVNRIFRNQNHK